MPLLLERPPESIDSNDICPVCKKPIKKHTIAEIKNCSKKLKDLKSGA